MQPRPQEIKALSGARALPALMIVLYHFSDAHRYVPLAPLLGAPVHKGYLWVEFFFALSGFILVHVYGGRRPFDYGTFLKARLARLYPLHLFTLLSILALMSGVNALAHAAGFVSIYEGHGPPLNTAWSFVANLFLVQAWNIVPGLSWNTVAWFVSIEFLLCLIFPAYLRLADGGPWRGLALIAAGIAWLILLAWNSHVGLDITFRNGVFRGMAGFMIGVGLAIAYRFVKDAADGAPEWKHSIAQVLLLIALGFALYASGPAKSRADVWTAVTLDALVLALAFDRGVVARVLASRPLQNLGEWSFGIYMGQTFWMQAVRQFDEQTYRLQNHVLLGVKFGQWMWMLEPIVVLFVCIAWGALLTHAVEQPANVALRRWLFPQHPIKNRTTGL